MPYKIQVVSLRSLKADPAINLLFELFRFRRRPTGSDRPSTTPAMAPALGVELVFRRTPDRPAVVSLIEFRFGQRSPLSRSQNPILNCVFDRTFNFALDRPFNRLHGLAPSCASDRPLVGSIILFSVVSLIWHPHSTALIEPQTL